MEGCVYQGYDIYIEGSGISSLLDTFLEAAYCVCNCETVWLGWLNLSDMWAALMLESHVRHTSPTKRLIERGVLQEGHIFLRALEAELVDLATDWY